MSAYKFYPIMLALLVINLNGKDAQSIENISLSSSQLIISPLHRQILTISQANNKKEIAAIRAVFDANLQALRQKNLAAAMATIDETSPFFEQTRKVTQFMFENYDLKYEINQFEVLNISGNQATVRITQTTKKIQGPTFRDNILVSKNLVKKSRGKWKIFSTEIESIKYLN
jgi:hypothetical protein